jgi:hypothetical protein
VSIALLIPLAAAVAGAAAEPTDTVNGLRVGFAITAGLALAGGAATLALLRRPS